MLRKKAVLGAVIGVLLVVGVVVWHSFCSYPTIIKANWDISLPTGGTEVYQKLSDKSFHGDGIRYHVIFYKDTEKVNQILQWKPLSSTSFQDEPIVSAQEWLDKIGVSDDWRPEYQQCVCRYRVKEDGSKIILLWNEQNNYLYIVELFL